MTEGLVHSPTPSTLCGDEADLQDEQLLEQELMKQADEMEPSIEMARDFKEPGDVDSRPEINTSAGMEQQTMLEHQQEENQESADSRIQENRDETETVASGCQSSPVVDNGSLSEPPPPDLSNREIPQENIKHALHEIISEIDREMEADMSNEEVRFFHSRSDGAPCLDVFRFLSFLCSVSHFTSD